MKWYPRDPAAAIEGMIGLSPEERGFYNLVIDLLYARDGKGVTDALVCSAMGCRPQVWRRVKAKLLRGGKIGQNATGELMANRVETTLQTAAKRMGLLRGFRGQFVEYQRFNPTVNGGKTKTRYSYSGEVQQGVGEGKVIEWREAEQWKRR